MTVAGRRAAAMATAMAATAAERAVLVRRGGGREGEGGGPGRMTAGLSPQEEEFRWLLHDEVHAVLRQLQDILKVPRPRPPPVPACRAPVPGAARAVQTRPCPQCTWSLVGGHRQTAAQWFPSRRGGQGRLPLKPCHLISDLRDPGTVTLAKYSTSLGPPLCKKENSSTGLTRADMKTDKPVNTKTSSSAWYGQSCGLP